jgi:hypothetical protein
MDTTNTRNDLYLALVALAEEINGGPVDEGVKDILKTAAEVAEDGLSPFEAMPVAALKEILGESFDSTMGYWIPAALSNGGMFDNEFNHKFTPDNECPYFLKSELCALDGRICPYDTETYPVCNRYKEGHTRNLEGPDGRKPEVSPKQSVPRDPNTQQSPLSPTPFRKV